MKRILAVLVCLAAVSFSARAQRWSVGVNMFDLACIGTFNIEGNVAIAQHISLEAGAKYNPWTFKKDTDAQFEDRKQIYYAGFRFWPWYIYSGFWGSICAQYEEYNHGGLIRKTAKEGDAIGASLTLGYTRMFHRNFNIEFGAGVWAGQTKFTQYSCPKCGRVLDEGSKFFVLPNEIKVAIVYVF